MRTFKLTFCIAIVIVCTMAQHAMAFLDARLETQSSSAVSSCFVLPLSDLGHLEVTFSNHTVDSCKEPAVQTYYSEISKSSLALLDDMETDTSEIVFSPIATTNSLNHSVKDSILLTDNSNSALLFVIASLSYLVFVKLRSLCLYLHAAISALYKRRHISAGFDTVVGLVDNNAYTGLVFDDNIRDSIAGRSSLATGFAGLLRKVTGSASAVYTSIYNSKMTYTMVRQSFSVRAILFAPVSILAHVSRQVFWENTFTAVRQLVFWHTVGKLGRVRLAAVFTGLSMLIISEKKPGFNRSFAIGLPAFVVALLSTLFESHDIMSGQVNIYHSVYQSRRFPLYNLAR